MSDEERRRRRNARRWCQRKYRLASRLCERCPDGVYGLAAPATERHHLNGDVTNNAPTNIALVCGACHDALHLGDRWHADRDPSRWVSNGGTGAVSPQPFGYRAH